MTELEQLRKEVNELRERLARLEARHPVGAPVPRIDWTSLGQPTWVGNAANNFPPGTIIC